MNYASVILAVLGALYGVMRPILQRAVNDPDAEWDDRLMKATDCLFGYEK
jgi:hypothetical protein